MEYNVLSSIVKLMKKNEPITTNKNIFFGYAKRDVNSPTGYTVKLINENGTAGSNSIKCYSIIKFPDGDYTEKFVSLEIYNHNLTITNFCLEQ